MKNTTLAFIALILATGCSSQQKKEEAKAAINNSVSQEAHIVANENKAPFVTELAFNKGSKNLTKFSRQQLQQTLTTARNNGEVKEIKVVTWADQEYPSVHAKALPKSQVELANKRNDEIKNFIQKDLNSNADVTVYSMAERPGAISELFSTSNARIKESLEVAGVPNTDTAVKAPSKAQKAIVMFILK